MSDSARPVDVPGRVLQKYRDFTIILVKATFPGQNRSNKLNKIYFKYSVDQPLPWKENSLYGLQWFMISAPLIIILGQVGAAVHYPDNPQLQLLYLQKVFFVTGATLLLQLLWGHKLPIIVGPAAVLLLGIIANSAGPDQTAAIYSTIALGGLALSILSAWGLMARLTALFTPLVTGIVLLLIAFTMLPTVLNFITAGPLFSFARGIFTVCLIFVLLAAQRILPELLRSTIIVWALLAGSLAYYGLFSPDLPVTAAPASLLSAWQSASLTLTIDWAVLISFLFCFIALTANDLGSIQTTAGLLGDTSGEKRTRRGLIFTGLGNMLAGAFGVLGPVNYSLSTGIILSSGCASRFPLLPAAAAMMVLACIPAVIQAFAYIPSIVIGALLFYMLCPQICGGLSVLGPYLVPFRYETGIVIGLPVLLGTCIAFLPAQAAQTIPLLWRPLFTNGFAVGVTAAIALERLLLTKKTGQ